MGVVFSAHIPIAHFLRTLCQQLHYVTEFHPDLITTPIWDDDATWNIYCVRLKSAPPNPWASRFLNIMQALIQEKEDPR